MIPPEVDAALEREWSLVPCGCDKRPRVKWQRFREERPSRDQVTAWVESLDPAAWAFVTGEISALPKVGRGAPRGTLGRDSDLLVYGWALRVSNPRPPPCKGEPVRAADLRFPQRRW